MNKELKVLLKQQYNVSNESIINELKQNITMNTGNIWYTAEQWAEVNKFTNEPIILKVIPDLEPDYTLEQLKYAKANEQLAIMKPLTKEEFVNAPQKIQELIITNRLDIKIVMKRYTSAKENHPEYFPN